MEDLGTYASLSESELLSISPSVQEKLNIAFDSINHEAKTSKEIMERLQSEQGMVSRVLCTFCFIRREATGV